MLGVGAEAPLAYRTDSASRTASQVLVTGAGSRPTMMMPNDDELWHQRVLARMDRMDERLNRLEGRINYLFGALAVLVVIADLLRSSGIL